MKLINSMEPVLGDVLFDITSPTKTAPDNRIESIELVCAFRDLAAAAGDTLEYISPYAAPSTPVVAAIVDKDFRAFYDLAAAGHTFMKHPSPEKERRFQREFADISRAGIEFMKSQYRADWTWIEIDRNTYLPRGALFNFERDARPPIDEWAFWDMSNAWGLCDEYTNDFDCWGEDLFELWRMGTMVDGFREHTRQLENGSVRLSKRSLNMSVKRDVPKAVAYMSVLRRSFDAFMEFRDMTWDLMDCFMGESQLLKLPAELRLQILHKYLILESEAGRLSKHRHYDEWQNPCCFWDFPKVLVACDNQDPGTFPPPETARAPRGWLPALAFTNKDMLGEVAVYMLQKTKRFDLKYMYSQKKFKIATWLRKFLEALPNNEGLDAVRYLNFPHMHWFNHLCYPASIDNPSIDLAVACRNLKQIDMTFHWSKVTVDDPHRGIRPTPIKDLVARFCLEDILKCEKLEYIYLDGAYGLARRGGMPQHLDALGNLAKWFLHGFLVRQEREIKVEVVRRSGAWKGRQAGTMVKLNQFERIKAKKMIMIKKGELVVHPDASSRCAMPQIL
ncbi:hypothetical protein HBI56_034130 [Parastagonospora nodorum]|nr:hypothetical protein HBH53_164180 [Parastagonospora nodorum]KAH3967612.1 hypothetical protein HBH51_136000 [Parastagonospora nodorum]KAH4007023.1 hypothetical protein HBI10_012490 [Parastagonospora nodorum]KAH4011478.1 hypothetical protein HBI13_198100 [Parastagonospora nodorum]KAH4034599.1 hypothetical protein HBI09_100900 [Parastagonospora nodorum]